MEEAVSKAVIVEEPSKLVESVASSATEKASKIYEMPYFNGNDPLMVTMSYTPKEVENIA